MQAQLIVLLLYSGEEDTTQPGQIILLSCCLVFTYSRDVCKFSTALQDGVIVVGLLHSAERDLQDESHLSALGASFDHAKLHADQQYQMIIR